MNSKAHTGLILLSILALVSGCARKTETETTGDWPQWRGPEGRGVSPLSGLPHTWSTGSANIRWTTEIPGVGNSSPVVSGGRVYLTSAYDREDEPRRVVLSLDLQTGELLWETRVGSAPREARHQLNTSSAPTPAADDGGVYAYFGSVLARLDTGGEVVWRVDVDPDYVRYSRYGAGSSPVLMGDAVVVVQDREFGDTDDVGWFAAYDRATGRQIWRNEWQDTCCSYSTPVVVDRPSGRQLLLAHSGMVAGYDAADGRRLWSVKVKMGQNVPSLAIEGDLVCASGGATRVKSSACMRLGPEGAPEILWQSGKDPAKTASPVLHGGLFFVVSENGVLTCYDAASGTVHWRRRLKGGGYHVSLTAGDGNVYAANARGLTTVLTAGPEFERIAESDLGEGGTASPAFAGDCLLIRTHSRLFCIGKESLG